MQYRSNNRNVVFSISPNPRLLGLWDLLSGKMATTRVAPLNGPQYTWCPQNYYLLFWAVLCGAHYWLNTNCYSSVITASGVIVALQRGSARDSTVLHLLHFYGSLWPITEHNIGGVDSCTADHFCLGITCIVSSLLTHRLHLSQHQYHHSFYSF